MRWSLLAFSFVLLFLGCGDDQPPSEPLRPRPNPILRQDGDGFIAISCGGDDCDDHDPNKYPPDHGCDKRGGCTWPPCTDPGPMGLAPGDPEPMTSMPAPSSTADDSSR